MTIKLIVGWRTPVLNTPQRDIMLVHGSLTYWQSDCALRCAKAKFFGYTSRVTLGGEDVRLLVPTTFMNLSGKAVAAMASFSALIRTKFWWPTTNWICLTASPNLSWVAVMVVTMD